MRLIVDHGMRLDRPVSELDRMLRLTRCTPYRDLPDDHKRDLVRLLAQAHHTRERIRFSKQEALQ